MKPKSLCLCFALLSILIISACSRGPSDEDVGAAFDVVNQILDNLPNGLNAGIVAGLQDSDLVEFTFNNDDYSIVQDGRLDLIREQGHLDMEFLWTLSDYVEPRSGQGVNGTIKITGSGNIYDQETITEDMGMELDLNFNTGAVTSMAFILDNEVMSSQTIPPIKVNGEPYQIQDPSFAAMLKQGLSVMRIQ